MNNLEVNINKQQYKETVKKIKLFIEVDNRNKFENIPFSFLDWENFTVC